MDIFVEFVENTIVSLTCGCVSLVTIGAICLFVVFFAFDVVPKAFPTKEPFKYGSYFRVVKKVHDEVDDVDVDEEEIIEKKANNLTNDKCQYAENDAVAPIARGDDEPEKNCDFGCSFCQAAIAIGMYGVNTIGNETIYGDGIDRASADHSTIPLTTTTAPTMATDTIATYVDEYEIRHSWRCNWLFRETKKNREYKKRRLRSDKTAATFPIAVPMLVPNPSTCTYRALIGDLDVDETSDLSSDERSASISGDENDNENDDDDNDVGDDNAINRKDELVEAKNIEYIYKYNIQHCSLLPPSIKTTSHTRVDSEDDYTMASSVDYIDYSNDAYDSCGEYEFYDRISSPLLAYARRQKSSRCANNQKMSSAYKIHEKCDDRQLDSGEGGSLEESSSSEVDQDLMPRGSNSPDVPTIDDRPTNDSDNDPSNAVVVDQSALDEQDFAAGSESESERLSCPPKPGTIAEREHSKWEHAAPMLNNPYTEESIRKRNIENQFFPSIGTDRESCNSTEECRENGGSDFVDGDNSLSKYRKDYYVNENLSVSIVNNDNITVYDTTCRDGKTMAARVDSMDDEEKTTTSKSQPSTPTSSLVRVSSWSERRGVRARHSENDADSVIGRQNGTRSVKELAKQFSQYATTIKMEDTTTPNRHLHDKFSNSVHSLTARSTSKEFRDELKNRTTPAFNRNVHVFVPSPPASLSQSAAISE